MRDIDLALFHLVYLVEDLLEGFLVGGTEVLSVVGGLCHLGEQVFVEFDGDVLVAFAAKGIAEGVGGKAFGADADGVETYVVERGNLGGTLRVDSALVVDTVGKEDDDFALGFAVFDAVDGGGKSVAEGGAVLGHTVFEPGELFEEYVVVDGEGNLGEGFACKDDKTHAVAFASVDEVGCHFLGSFETVGFEVFGQHAAADIHGQDDVDAFHLHLLTAKHALGACQSNDDGCHGNHAEDEKQRVSPLAEGFAHPFEQADIGELQGWLLLSVAHDVPHRHQGDD